MTEDLNQKASSILISYKIFQNEKCVVSFVYIHAGFSICVTKTSFLVKSVSMWKYLFFWVRQARIYFCKTLNKS